MKHYCSQKLNTFLRNSQLVNIARIQAEACPHYILLERSGFRQLQGAGYLCEDRPPVLEELRKLMRG